MNYILSKHIIKALSIIGIILLGGCVRNEVKVEFALPANVNDAYKMTYYASDPKKGWYVETVAAVQQGKAQMQLATRNPSLVFVIDNSRIPRAVFYIERGDKIKITGDGADPVSWIIKGNELSEEWTQWRINSRAALSSADFSKINGAVADFVKKNPEKPLSTLLLLTYFNRRLDPALFNKLWKTLKGKALEPKWMQLVSRSDLLAEAPLAAHELKRILLRSIGNGVDTLRFPSVPAIMYFRRDDDAARDEGVKILRGLAKDYPDSASRIIADISFDADSMSWTARVRRDSLSGIIRAWNMHAEADTDMIRMGVERTPWFVVLDAKGKRKYAGDDPQVADSLFRKTIPSKKQ